MHRLSTSERLKLLTLATSLAGILCMSLADLLPLSAFIFFAALHAAIGKWFYENEMISQKTALAMIVLIFVIEAPVVVSRGSSAVVLSLRDMILAIAVIRLVMRKTPREIYQIVGISFAQCLLATIFTISPLFLPGVSLMALLIPMTLYTLDAEAFSGPGQSGAKGSLHWLRITMGIILTACLLFYLLPRPTSSIIQHGFAHRKTIEYKEDVNLRKTAPDETGNDVMMRVVWSTGKAPSQFYLSGSRLEGITPDGFIKDETRGSATINPKGFTDILKIYPAELSAKYVFFPYWITGTSPKNFLIRGSNIYWSGEIPPVYDVWVNRMPGKGVPCKSYLPEKLSAIGRLARSIAGQGDTRDKANRLSRFLMTTYRYSLDAQQIPPGRSAIDWFVFSGKKGSCEHFASALAAMMRGCGVPSRVVTGFLVTEYNENGNYFIVRSSDAHAWVEYWDGTWHSIDATPYGRRVSGLQFHLLDELRFRWLRWVIQYSLDDQIQFAIKIFVTAPQINRQLENLSSYALYLFITVVLFWLSYLFYRDRWLSPYEKVRRAMVRKGLSLPENSPHECHLLVVREKWPSLENEFMGYLKHYLDWRFGETNIDIQCHTRKVLESIKAMPKV